jgi:predicted transposase YdaD
MALTDTPIYDQIRQELEAGTTRGERAGRRSRAADEGSQTVSVWSLVNQHGSGKRR